MKIREKLLTSGVRMEDDITDKVTMVTVAKQQNEPRHSKNESYNNQRNNRNQGQQRKEKQEPSGPPVTECAYCELIRNKDVPHECLTMGFKDRHRVVTDRPIYPNDCLAWLKLSIDDREKVLEDNELKCRRCLRGLRQNIKGNACGKGNHTFNNGRNGMCLDKSCDRHSTLCKTHEELNKNRHQILRRGLEWANRVRPQTPGRNTDNMPFVMIVDEEVESNSEKELDEMDSVRKEIQIKTY